MKTSNNNNQNILKAAKRIALTVVITLPFLIVFGYLTRKVITSNVLQIVCFTAILGFVVLVEELIAYRREKRKTKIEHKDVFK